MSNKNFKENFDNEENFADNIADDVSKEQTMGETGEKDLDEKADNLAEELDKLNNSYLRLMAEYDNYRKRTIKEKAELIKNGGEKVLVGLLPVADDFERALQTVETAKDIDAVKEGIELIHNKFMNFLQQNGVKPIESLNEPFDDELYEAVAAIPATSEKQKGKVIDNIQTGYTLNDKVIRHAKVVVAN